LFRSNGFLPQVPVHPIGFIRKTGFLSVVVRTVIHVTISEQYQDLTDDEARKVISDVVASGEPPAAEQIESLTDNALTLLLRTTTSGIARLEAVQVCATAALCRRREDAAEAKKELAQALNINPKNADAMIEASQALTSNMPKTFRLMQDGQLTLDRASKVTQAARRLTDVASRATDAEVAPRLADKNPTQVRKAAYYAAQKADPAGAKPGSSGSDGDREAQLCRRRKKTGLTLSSRNSDTATLTLSGVPTKDATEAVARINQAAEARKTHDEPRSIDELCADVALELLLAPHNGMPQRQAGTSQPRRPDHVSRRKPRRGRAGRSRRQSRKASKSQNRRAERRAATKFRRSARRRRQ